MQCRINLIVTYKQFYLNSSSISNETQFYSQVEKSWFQSCCQQNSLKKPLIRWCSITTLFQFNGSVQCFSRQVVMKKCFTLNPEKKLAQFRVVVFEKSVKNASIKW